MNTIIKDQVQLLAESASNDPVLTTLLCRTFTSIINQINNVSSTEAAKLLALQDHEFSLELGNAIAARQMVNTPNTPQGEPEKAKTTQKFLLALNEHGGGYTANQLAEALNMTKQGISNRKNRKQLFYVKVAGQIYFPKFQFDHNNKVNNEFKKIITILAPKDKIASFFLLIETLSDGNGQVRPIYQILCGDKQPRYIYDQIEQKAQALHAKMLNH